MKKFRLDKDVSARLQRSFAPLVPALLGLRAGAHRRDGRAPLPVAVVREAGLPGETIRIDKDGAGALRIAISDDLLRDDPSYFSALWKRLGVFVDLLSDPAIASAFYPCALGDSATEPGRALAFCSNLPGTVLVPDRAFLTRGGYAAERTAASRAPRWRDRDGTVLWRGGITGWGTAFNDTMSPDDAALIQRVRLCLAARGIAGADIKFAASGSWPSDIAEAYARAGIAGQPIPQAEWLNRRFAIDADGNSNAFSNLYVRLVYGCCVLKVASAHGFRQWYYDELVAWTHYVPVAADLSDLATRIAWCRDNPDECERIAAAGQAFAMARTVETERTATIAKIRRAWTAA